MINPYRRPRRTWTWRHAVAALSVAAVLASLLVTAVVAVSLAQAPGCETSRPARAQGPAGRPPASAVNGHPLAVAALGDDVVFVSLRAWGPGGLNGIEVLRRTGDALRSQTVIPLRSGPAGLALSPDGRVLLAAVDDAVAVLDAPRAGEGDPSALLGYVPTGAGAGTTQVAAVGSRYVFTADEVAGHVTVLDLARIEDGDLGPAVQVGVIDVDMGPSGLGASPDGRYLYVVSQVQRPVLRLGMSDFVYGLMTYLGVPRRAGTLSVVDVRRVEINPGRAVVATVPAGCGPVRVAAAPDGKTVWVTARQSNELLAFRTDQLHLGRPAAPAARVPIGSAPLALRLVRDGRFALVADSERSYDASQSVAVIDTAAALAGRASVRSALTVGGLPRDIALTDDGRRAYVANNGSSDLTMLDLAALPGA